MDRATGGIGAGRALSASSPRLGISIGAQAVALVELWPRRPGARIACAGVEPRRRGEQQARPALERLLERLAPSAHQVVTALDADRLLEQRVELPAGLGVGEVERHLAARLGRLTATLDESFAFDFSLADGASAAAASRLTWRLVACRPSELEARLDEFAGLGLEVAAVEVDLFALPRLLSSTPQEALLYRDGQRLWLLRDGLKFEYALEGGDPAAALAEWLPTVWGEAPPARLWLGGVGWAQPRQLSRLLERPVAAYDPQATFATRPQRGEGKDSRLALAFALAARGLR